MARNSQWTVNLQHPDIEVRYTLAVVLEQSHWQRCLLLSLYHVHKIVQFIDLILLLFICNDAVAFFQIVIHINDDGTFIGIPIFS